MSEPRRPHSAALLAVITAGVIMVVGAVIGIGLLSPAPSGSVDPSGTSEPTPSVDQEERMTASTEELGVRLTLTLDRGQTAFGQRVWADATIENLGPGTLYWDASCAWPVHVTASPEVPLAIDEGRDDWPGDIGLFKVVLTPEPIFSDRQRGFEAEAVLRAGSAGGCPPAVDLDDLPDGPEVLEGGSLLHRAGWNTDDYMGMPPVPGRYTVQVTFSFWRGVEELPSDAAQQTVHVTLPLLVTGEDVDWLSPEQAIDPLLADVRFADILAEIPSTRWANHQIAFDDERWVVTLDVGPPMTGPPEADVIGVVDARTGAVLDVQLEDGLLGDD